MWLEHLLSGAEIIRFGNPGDSFAFISIFYFNDTMVVKKRFDSVYHYNFISSKI